MKENRTNQRAAGIRGRTKRYLAAVIAIILTLALSTTAFADNGRGGTSGGQGNGSRTQQPNTGDSKGSETRLPDGKNDNANKRNADMEGIQVEKIEEAIAALTDEDAKASLTTLLGTYVDAWTAKQTAVSANETADLASLTEAITAAKAALDTALAAAGIATDTLYGEPEEAKDGTGRMNNRPTLDTDEIATAIAALDDSDADKATLTSLLEAYQTALTAAQADTSSLSETEIAALNDTLSSAEKALLEAARAAEIIGGNGRGQFVSGNAYGKAELDVASITSSISALDDTNENKAALTTLLETYQAALTAQAAADETTLSQAEIDALNDATKAAASALKEALENAGIDVPRLQLEEQQTKTFEFSVVPGTNADSSDNSGVVQSFLSWLKSLFE